MCNSFLAFGVGCFLCHGLCCNRPFGWAGVVLALDPFFVVGLLLPILHVVQPVILNIYTGSPRAR